ncbi:MAG: TetR family transcriptional regulator [Bradyrhizobium sp.]|nr:TetR family transcriptional regulator [Bradyrhizobium sp.]
MVAKRGALAAPTGKRRERKARRRDDLILDALERLLAKQSMSELDVEPIAAEAGITRTRFYFYFQSKHDALAALLRRLGSVLRSSYEHPGSWFVGRAEDVRPREAMSRTIDLIAESWIPHRFVVREASDMWTVLPAVRDAWLEAVDFASSQMAAAIERERALGVAPPGLDAKLIGEALIWQSERTFFRLFAEIPGAMGAAAAKEACLELLMRTIFLADDPDPRPKRARKKA